MFGVGVLLQVLAKQLDLLLNFRTCRVVARRCSYCYRGEGRAEISRCIRFPRLVMKVQPCPRAFQLACFELESPHVAEGLSRIIGKNACRSVPRCENHSVQKGFGAARLAALRPTMRLIVN